MPLLNKKPFRLQPIPADLKPDEEVFVCTYTKEVFRNYDDFFNRSFLCKTSAWTCELTGRPNLTYQQAIESEQEANEVLDSILDCHKRAILSLVHHATRTNFKTLVDEVAAFYKERYVVGEDVEYTASASDKRSVVQARVVAVIPPSSQQKSPPVKVPVISISPLKISLVSGKPVISTPILPDSVESLSNSVTKVCTPESEDSAHQVSFSSEKKKHASTPLSSASKLNPYDYQYQVQSIKNPSQVFSASGRQLSRPKSALTKEKIKLFLRNTLHKQSDRHPLLVKEEYVKKFGLGPSSVKRETTPSTSASGSARKRSLSQASLDGFFSPSAEPKKMRPVSLTPTLPVKKKKAKSLKSSKSPGRPGRKKSQEALGVVSTPKPDKKPKVAKTPKPSGKMLKTPVTIATPAALSEAKKVLKKAKQMKQMDLKKNLVKKVDKKPLTEADLIELRRKAEEKRLHRLAEKEAEKERRREERIKKVQENREMRRLEKLRKIEWMKPREDMLCEDSKILPKLDSVVCALPVELFGDAVMLLEFFSHFGAAFNIKDAIREPITFGKVEEALVSHSTDTILFELVKFLLQSIFLIMDEEHETLVQLDSQERLAAVTATVSSDAEAAAEDGGRSATGSNSIASRRSSIGSIAMEGIEEHPLDVRLASLKESAAVYAKWPQLTQATPLHSLVLDPYTCTEVLRLHLLSCGGYQEGGDRQWFRYCNRGGFSDADDPVLELRLNHPELLDRLAVTSIYDLSPKDKSLVLSTLCSQLLVFASTRDFLEDAQQQAKRIRKEIRRLQAVLVKKDDRKKAAVDSKPVVDGDKNVNDKEVVGVCQGQQPEPVLADPPEAIRESSPTDVSSAEKATMPTQPQTEAAVSHELPQEESKIERNERILKEIEELERELYPLVATVNLKPLGLDRFYNRYWFFPSLAGLFVEKSMGDEESLVDCHSTVVDPTSQRLTYVEGPEGEKTPASTSPSAGSAVCLASSNTRASPELVDPALATNHVSSAWSCFTNEAELSVLLDSLNPRGEREVALQRSILRRKDHISSTISKCPISSSAAECATFPACSAEDYLELYLREQILDIEEKIYIGNLGYVRNVGDRKVWRDALESPAVAGDQGSAVVAATEHTSASTPSAQQLARALLQIQEGIERKFLLPPLGTAIDTKKKGRVTKKNGMVKESELCVDQWRASLSKATSLAQVFVHLATLERAVAWSKSLMNVRCRICRRKGGDEYMLLCDGCDHGYHTYCLRPPLMHIPDGDWFCYDCCPVTPVKRRRTAPISFKEESSESESGSDEEVDEEEEGQEVEEQSGGDATDEDSDVESKADSLRSRMRQSTRIQRKAVCQAKGRPQVHKRSLSAGAIEETKGRKLKTSTPPVCGARKKLRMEDNRNANNGELSKAEVIISAIIDIRCANKRQSREKEQHSLELELCRALLEELCEHPESWPFHSPIRRREHPDYYNIILTPITLKTIQQKVSSRKYTGLDLFLADVELLFSNCATYYKRHSPEAKAGAALHRFMEKRYSDLGLGNFTDITLTGFSNIPKLRNFKRRQ